MIGQQMVLFKKSRRGRPHKKHAGVSHLRRPVLKSRFPVHVTMKVRRDVGNLRARDCSRALTRAFRDGSQRVGFRLVGYSVQYNHIHLLVEGADANSLSRGMQGLNIRMARRLNRALGRSGKVFTDRYHARILRTPTQVANARHYVLNNHAHHFEQRYGYVLPNHITDPFAHISATAETWLLREGYRRGKPSWKNGKSERCLQEKAQQ